MICPHAYGGISPNQTLTVLCHPTKIDFFIAYELSGHTLDLP